ncbi:MAG: 2TM domain-containing protein, partial [Flavobacteriaceae bacterium]|nr:2TM domain-containing protein [Flavobacteriaceae bacterium]
QNVLNKKSVLGKSTKVGLKNIEERYGLISRRPVFIKEEDGVFTVKLPLLTQKIKKMSTNRLTEDKYMRARKKVDEIKGFYLSLIAYILVIPFLFFIWLKFTSHTIQWFWFPMFGWGIGLVFQGFSAFGTPIFGNNWEERKIKELMEKDKKEYWK